MSEDIETVGPAMKRQKISNVEQGQMENPEDPKATGDPPDKDNNFASPEEFMYLREFRILDEVKSNDGDSNDDDSDVTDGKSEADDLPEEEIEKMLDADLPENFKCPPKPKEKPFVTRQKTVLEEKGIDQFEVLPLDWMMARHCSGMPIYMHRTSRVCTLSKPYFLGKGNIRRHDIPISAIPCLAYRKALAEEAKQKEIDEHMEEQIKSGTWQNIAGPSSSTTTTPSTYQSAIPNKQIDQTDLSISQIKQGESSGLVNKDMKTYNPIQEPGPSKCPFLRSDISTGEFEKDVKDSNDDTNADNDPKDITSNVTKQPPSNTEVNLNNGKESEVLKLKELPLNRQPVILPGGIVMPPPRVETVSTSWKTQHLSPDEIYDYCKKLFLFKTVNMMHFNRWADRRKYMKARKTLQYPTLPEGTKLITIPAGTQDRGSKSNKRDWVMNMNGRSYLSVFHEYVRRALQLQPIYEFRQLENASSPYEATVYIGGMQYGVGHGSSKRAAKSLAARASLHILIPEMRTELDTPRDQDSDSSFFDCIGIEDPRITEFCAATCEPSPHSILRTCLLRNFGASDRHINTEMKKLEYQKMELTMKVGKHTATVVCKNKKEAKQRASQAILQALHPHIHSWGSLLRLYGSRSVKSCKEKKLEEQQITLLQDAARQNEPNYAVLEKLRSEMKKLQERDNAVVPIGTILLADDLPTHSGSNLNNVDL